jgi:hypothetical protein
VARAKASPLPDPGPVCGGLCFFLESSSHLSYVMSSIMSFFLCQGHEH